MKNETLRMIQENSFETETALQFPSIEGLVPEAMESFQQGMRNCIRLNRSRRSICYCERLNWPRISRKGESVWDWPMH